MSRKTGLFSRREQSKTYRIETRKKRDTVKGVSCAGRNVEVLSTLSEVLGSKVETDERHGGLGGTNDD